MKTKDIVKKMAEIVESRMTNYKNDFYEYDMERIAEHPREFVWMVRETGTNLMTPPITEGTPNEVRENKEFWRHCYGIFKGANKWFYHVRMNEDGSGEIVLSEKRCDEFARRVA